jgi:hypothetical protein
MSKKENNGGSSYCVNSQCINCKEKLMGIILFYNSCKLSLAAWIVLSRSSLVNALFRNQLSKAEGGK